MTAAPLQPTLKASSTAQHSQLSAVAGSTPTISRAASPARPRKQQRQDSSSNDFLSEKSTVSLIRRVLVPDTHGLDRGTPAPIEALLPPLTSSNDVDLQLYAIIAVIVKDFINPWYTKITPDQTFVEEVTQIIAHCSRALEQRLRQVDAAELLLDEIPAVIESHVVACRTASESRATRPYDHGLLQIYNSLNPHPALDPTLSSDEQIQAERIYRQLLIQGAIAVLLPTEDLQNASLRTLVTDIVADLILGRAIDDRLCQPWFLHSMVSKIIATVTSRAQPNVTDEETQTDARGRLEQFGLLSAKGEDLPVNSPPHRQSWLVMWFWRILQWGYFAFMAMRFTTLGLVHARRHPRSTHASSKQGNSDAVESDPSPRPVLDYRAFSTISTLLDLSRRMPWLAGALALLGHVLTFGRDRAGGPRSTLDRFLHQTITTHVLPPTLIPLVLRNLRALVFPNNSLGPPAPPPPTSEEALTIRHTAARDLLSVIPSNVYHTLFASEAATAEEADETSREQVEDILDLFSDARINKYLIYGILETIIVRLVPEMEAKTPSELLAERGIVVDDEEGLVRLRMGNGRT